VPTALDLCPLSLAINSSDNSPEKTKERKEKERKKEEKRTKEIVITIKLFLLFLCTSKILIFLEEQFENPKNISIIRSNSI
jgi:hypothetical protein